MEALIRSIVIPIVDHPNEIQVEEEEDDKRLIYHLTVHPDDVGKVIGKNGRIAKAIRTVVYASNSHLDKRVVLNIT